MNQGTGGVLKARVLSSVVISLGLGCFKLYLWGKNLLEILYCNQLEQLAIF